METQTNLFEFLGLPLFKITKPIRLISLFSGYDSQALALKYLGVDFEHYHTCEWAIKSIQALKDLHFENDNTDYSKGLTKEQLEQVIFNYGVSQNYNESLKMEQVKRLGEKNLRKIYNNIKATRNLVNIQNVTWKDLEIVDTYLLTYLLTYSFPCQDLSLAGKRKGMASNETRSGMLREVERILLECKEHNCLPQVLVMENVVQVHDNMNKKYFKKWLNTLEELGYTNFVKDIVATDFEIPQSRIRCFMISILGNYNYYFPKEKPLKIFLEDELEKKVDKKYFISAKLLNCFLDTKNRNGFIRAKSFKPLSKFDKIAHTITTKSGTRASDNYIFCNCLGELIGGKWEKTFQMSRKVWSIKGTAPTITTFAGGNTEIKILVNDENECKIRKLTPKECFRLMGVRDSDFEKIAKNQSNSSLYHLAGDSIVVNVLMAIFKAMID